MNAGCRNEYTLVCKARLLDLVPALQPGAGVSTGFFQLLHLCLECTLDKHKAASGSDT